MKNKPIKYYQNCGELVLYIFIKVYSSDDLYLLIISGKPTDEQLRHAWDNIIAEYSVLSKDTQKNYLISCLKDISFLENKLYLIQIIVDQLKAYRDQQLIDQLNLMGFKFQYDIYGSDRYVLELDLTITQSKMLLLKLKQRQDELNELKRSTGDKGENEYDLLLTELSKFQGYRLDPHIITVSEFCAIVNRFKMAYPVK